MHPAGPASSGAPMPCQGPAAVIIDTDGGVDDAAALWWALLDPELDVLAVTVVWGNVALDKAVLSVGRVLAAAGRPDIPVATGATGPVGTGPGAAARHVHPRRGRAGQHHRRAAPAADDAGRRSRRPTCCAGCAGERPGRGVAAHHRAAVHPGSGPGGRPRVRGHGAGAGRHGRLGARRAATPCPTARPTSPTTRWPRPRWRPPPGPQPPLLVGLDVTREATLTDAHFALLAEHRSPAAAFLDAAAAVLPPVRRRP